MKRGASAPQVIGLVFLSLSHSPRARLGLLGDRNSFSTKGEGKAGCFPVKASLFKFELLFKKQNVKKQHGFGISGFLGEMLKVGS